MRISDVVSQLRKEGYRCPRNQIYRAVYDERIDEPGRDESGRYDFRPKHLAQLRRRLRKRAPKPSLVPEPQATRKS